MPNHRDASVRRFFKKPKDPLDDRSLRSLVALNFLVRHRGRDQIDHSIPVGREKPIEGVRLRGVVFLRDRAYDVIVQVNLHGLALPCRSAGAPLNHNPRLSPASARLN